ncbi:MAG: hypothetical protein AABP62_14835 [Planctomycetota bacterium]
MTTSRVLAAISFPLLTFAWAHAETYEVRYHRTVTMTNAEADTIFNAAVTVLRSDGAGDVNCVIDWTRDDDVEVFTDGDGSIDDRAELTAVLNREGNIKVVQFINYCGGPNVSAVGCGETPGEDFAVEKTIAANIAGIVWVHEYGHNKGLQHRNGATNVMADAVGPGNRFINQPECDAYRTSGLNRRVPALVAGNKEHEGEIAPEGAVEYVRKLHIRGIDWSHAARISKESVPTLLKMLADPKDRAYQANIVTVLCIIGDDETAKSLIKYYEEGEGPLEVDDYSGRLAVLMHLGNLLNRVDSDSAWRFVLANSKASDSRPAKVKWSRPGFAQGNPDEKLLQNMAIWALGISGKPRAMEALQSLRKQDDRSKETASIIREAMVLNSTIREKGMSGYLEERASH